MKKRTKLTPEQVAKYEKLSGFKTTGEVYVDSIDDKTWKLVEDLYAPKDKDEEPAKTA